MQRKRVPKPRLEEDGTVTIRLNIPEVLWRLAVQIGQADEDTPERGLARLLRSINARLKKGDVKWLDPAYEDLAQQVINEDPTVIGNGLPPIDYGKLHRSSRAKSGFVGVYSNGQGFRGDARHANGVDMISIGTFPTAVEAAWRRYLHHQKHGLPYGEFEFEIEVVRKNPLLAGFSEDALRQMAAYEMGLRNASTDSIPDAYKRWYNRNPILDMPLNDIQAAGSASLIADRRMAPAAPLSIHARAKLEADKRKQQAEEAGFQRQIEEHDARAAQPTILRIPSGKEIVFDDSIDYAAIGAGPANAEERNEERHRKGRACQRCKRVTIPGHNARTCTAEPAD